MAKYKVGDKVRIVSERPASPRFVDSMEKYLGKTLTVSKVVEETLGAVYQFEEAKYRDDALLIVKSIFPNTTGKWSFIEDWISGLAELENPEFSVSVHFHDRLTVAELVKDGKVVKVENARCNPKDKFSMAEGARIAVERLFKKTADKPEEASKPKIGDKFIIVWNRSSDCIHHFKIGSVVTLKYIGTGKNIYEADDGLEQIVRDCDVAPYREKAK